MSDRLTIRLDPETEEALQRLLEHYETSSDAIRAAIQAHARTVAPPVLLGFVQVDQAGDIEAVLVGTQPDEDAPTCPLCGETLWAPMFLAFWSDGTFNATCSVCAADWNS